MPTALCAAIAVAALAAAVLPFLFSELSVQTSVVALLSSALFSSTLSLHDLDPEQLHEQISTKRATVDKALGSGSKGPDMAQIEDVSFPVGPRNISAKVYVSHQGDKAADLRRPLVVLVHGERTCLQRSDAVTA